MGEKFGEGERDYIQEYLSAEGQEHGSWERAEGTGSGDPRPRPLGTGHPPGGSVSIRGQEPRPGGELGLRRRLSSALLWYRVASIL